MTGADAQAVSIAGAVRAGRASAREVVTAALERIARRDRTLNCFTHVTADDALDEAERVDARVAAGHDPGPLAGVPFAVKNLFDVAGVITLAGSKIQADRPPATRDAAAVAALRSAGAVLVGSLNMDEYAYGFTTENTHYGSIRVPAALCGVFGLKPTYGRVSRAGVALFAGAFDHVGPFARSVADLATAFDAIQGPDPADPVCADRPAAPCVPHVGRGIDRLRVATLGGHFASQGTDEALAAVTRVARALGADRQVTLPEPHRARAAAMIITAAEGSNVHLADLRRRAKDFDPLTRDRFLAGALLPASLYVHAQRFRAWYRARVAEVFAGVDVLLAPTTPWSAPPIGTPRTMAVGGVDVFTRSHLGVFTQPLSFIGLPVISVPVTAPGALPLGVQLVAAPFHEATLFRVAAHLETVGVVSAPVA